MDFKVGDLVQAKDTIRKYWVLQMRKGQKGTIKGFTEVTGYNGNGTGSVPCMVVELSNGEGVTVPVSMMQHYIKEKKLKIEELDNEALLENLGLLLKEESYSSSTKSKKYQKVLADIERAKTEILKRMGS